MIDRYRWVAAQRADGFPTSTACETAGVSRQAFYDWTRRQVAGPSTAETAEFDLVAAMRQIHQEFDQAYGSPRMTAELANRGFCVTINGLNV